jgi:hypothetical protein
MSFLTKLFLLIIFLNLIGSFFKRLQQKKRKQELMSDWEQEEDKEGQRGIRDDREDRPSAMSEPQDMLGRFFEKLKEQRETPFDRPEDDETEPDTAPVVWQEESRTQEPVEAVPKQSVKKEFEKTELIKEKEEEKKEDISIEPDDSKELPLYYGPPVEKDLSSVPGLANRLKDKSFVRQAVVLSEILGPPRALKEFNFNG